MELVLSAVSSTPSSMPTRTMLEEILVTAPSSGDRASAAEEGFVGPSCGQDHLFDTLGKPSSGIAT